MDFELNEARAVLERTPDVLTALLADLPATWTVNHEGPGTWTIREILAHLIHGENDDWIPRARHFLEWGEERAFSPFDRTYGFAEAGARPIGDLLAEFRVRRVNSLAALADLHLTSTDLARTGRHPEFGRVTLGQHLATWVAHDLTHLSQIVRVMAVQYRSAVGPWSAYLRVVRGV
jgi:hypothetical protein